MTSSDFVKSNIRLAKPIQVYKESVKPNVSLGLIWVLATCKSYQQRKNVVTIIEVDKELHVSFKGKMCKDYFYNTLMVTPSIVIKIYFAQFPKCSRLTVL